MSFLRARLQRPASDCRARQGRPSRAASRARRACRARTRDEPTGLGALAFSRTSRALRLGSHDAADRGGETGPLGVFLPEASPAGGGELIEFRAAIALRRFPLRVDKTLYLH